MIDAQTSMKNESLLIQQLSKPEQPIQDNQINNQEAVRKTIKRYQNKINQMLKLIKSQKSQNDHLKGQLKTLNQNLNNVISKLNHKSIKSSPQTVKDQVLKRQLDNQIKKNVHLQKQLQQLRVKIKGIDTQKFQQLQNQTKQKDRKIQQLTQSIKMYEKIQRQDKNMDIYKKQQQLVNKVNALNQQVLHLKNKLTKQKKQQQMQQKMMKRQHEQILNLQAKTKNSQLAKSPQKVEQKPSQTMNKTQSASKLNYLKQKYATNQTATMSQNDKNLKAKGKKSQRQQLIERVSQLQQRCQNLQVTKKAVQRHLKFQIQSLKTKVKALQSQLNGNKNVIKRKDQQANILMSKVKQSQRKNYSTLEPVQKVKLSEDFGSHALFDQRKQFRGLVHVQGSYRKFDDTEGLSLQKNYRIKCFTFGWFQEHILSLDTLYQLKDGTEKQVSSFKITHDYKNPKFGSLQLSDFQYIKQVQLYCSKFIQFIRIQTSRDKVLQVGNQKNRMKCKKFQFDIRTNQKPIAFMGAIDNKKIVGTQSNRELLISFGLEIKKKDVVGKSRYNPSRTASLVKNSSKSALQHIHNRNDKNIVDNQ